MKQTAKVESKAEAKINISIEKKAKDLDEGLKSAESNVSKKVMLTVVQDFRKKAAEKPPVNMEMIQ